MYLVGFAFGSYGKNIIVVYFANMKFL